MTPVRQWLDRTLGRVTMYRLLTIILVITAAASVLLSLVGQVSFPTQALLTSAAAALVGTVGTTVMISLAFRIRPHVESSIITGLLVYFLLFPSADPAGLGVIALAGVLATASKYLLAWRGRHIFNPAAAGVALVAVLQLDSAVWWIATGALLPFTLIGAFLVLYRTRRIPMAILFIVVSGVILTVRLTMGGQDVADALATTVISYPVIFFAGFMLSEPLTLPPRRWQQLVLAIVVGVLFTVPFTFGPIALSFEFALLVGNLLSFLVGQRRGIRLGLVDRRQLTPTAWSFHFQAERPVAYQPGQYIELTVPHPRQDSQGSRRIFSLASAPSSTGEVTIAMRVPPHSSTFKRRMLDMKPGTAIRATTVGGDFLLPKDRSVPLLLIAGGIGITPFLSQLEHEHSSGSERDIVLVYSVVSLEELAFTEQLSENRVLLVAPEAPAELPAAWRWVGPGPVSVQLLRDEVTDVADRTAFVSGAPSVVTTVRSALRSLGVRRVHTDYFTGY